MFVSSAKKWGPPSAGKKVDTDPGPVLGSIARGHVPALDGIRGIAILLVLVWHYIACQIGHGSGGATGVAWQSLSLTWSGVNLFMLLSGFLITGILLDHKDRPNLFKVFYARRALRILPLYLVLCAAFVIALNLRPANWGALLDDPLPLWSYLTLTQNFVMAARDSFGSYAMAPTWSLAVEEQFYLLIPLIVRFLPRRVVIAIFISCVLLAPVLRLAIGGVGAYVLFLARADSLMLGGLIAFAVRSRKAMHLLQQNRDLFIVGMLAMLGTIALISFTLDEAPLSDPFINFWLSIFYGHILLVPYVFRGAWTDTLLSWKPLRWIGLRSYAIYIFHQGVLGGLFASVLGRAPGIDSVQALALTGGALLATLVLSEVSMRLIEAPCLKFGHKVRYAPMPQQPEPVQEPLQEEVVPVAKPAAGIS